MEVQRDAGVFVEVVMVVGGELMGLLVVEDAYGKLACCLGNLVRSGKGAKYSLLDVVQVVLLVGGLEVVVDDEDAFKTSEWRLRMVKSRNSHEVLLITLEVLEAEVLELLLELLEEEEEEEEELELVDDTLLVLLTEELLEVVTVNEVLVVKTVEEVEEELDDDVVLVTVAIEEEDEEPPLWQGWLDSRSVAT